jgi:hypothetical protein
MKDTAHGEMEGVVVSVDRFGVVSAACRSELASGREQWFDGFVSQNEERGQIASRTLARPVT